MKIVIIEDELKVAKELAKMLTGIDDNIIIEAILPSVIDSVKWLQRHPHPDLIFSDIQLQDGLSFEIFSAVDVSSLIVFCTAYDQYAIRSFESLSIDYLLKPLDEQMLAKSLRKYRLICDNLSKQQSDYNERLRAVINENIPTFKTTLLVHFRENIIPVRTEKIQFIYMDEGQLWIYLEDNKSYQIKGSVESLEASLDPHLFFRANRKFIVHRNCILTIEHYFNRKYVIKTSVPPPELIVISKMKAPLFLNWLAK